jgi:polyvinyl alcohol dehydrogenase (cytochrome)
MEMSRQHPLDLSRRAIVPVVAAGIVLMLSSSSQAQGLLQTMQVFESRCAQCHGSATTPADGGDAVRAPSRAMLTELTPERILDAMNNGSMQANAKGMSEVMKRGVAELISGRPLGSAASGAASAMKNQCTAKPAGNLLAGPVWNGWGNDLMNTRAQSAAHAGLTADQVPKLALKWAFGFPNGSSAFGQPAVAGGRLFVGSDNGFVYSIDAATGCVYWSFEAKAGVRTAISIAPIKTAAGSRFAVYFGDLKANIFAVDAENGSLIWTARVDKHPFARITGAPTLANGRLYVPVSSFEEGSGSNDRYECCTFRGSVAAYDATSGKQLWQTYTVDEPKPTKKNKLGTQQYAPSGVAIWSAPTIDLKRRVLYVSTGNEYSGPGGPNSDAVIAMDLETGKIAWTSQVTPKDVYVVGCSPQRENCPETEGPDFDFGNSSILRDLPGGKTLLVIGQKSGVVWALDPDKKGALVWQRRVGRGSALGGLEWGSAADAAVGYFPVSDMLLGQELAGGLHALRLDTGAPVWEARPPRADCKDPKNCVQAQSAAISLMPGVVFSGTTTGIMRAYDTKDGRVIWTYDAAQPYTTVNGVQAKGGSFNGPGPVIAGGMVFMNAGYAYLGMGAAGNVLLAFAPQ